MEDRVTFVRSLDEPGPSNGSHLPLIPQQHGTESVQIQTRSSARNRGRQKRRRAQSDEYQEEADQPEPGVQTRSRRNTRRQIRI